MPPPLRRKSPKPVGSDFRLPPDVQVSRHPLEGGIAYTFRHAQLGELGRIVVKGTPSDETSVVTEVAGNVDDPITQRRREVLEPLSLAVIDVIGPGRTTPLPPARPGVPAGQVAGEEVHCETCGARVAFLVFAENAVDPASFEDYARLMFVHYAKFNVPNTYLHHWPSPWWRADDDAPCGHPGGLAGTPACRALATRRVQPAH